MINPADIQLAHLPWLPLEARAAFPRQPAIYFAIDSLEVVQYIGRSVDPKQRWAQHHRYGQLSDIGGVRIAYLFTDVDLLPVVEAALIAWFDPPLNVIKDDSAIVAPSRETMRNLRIAAGLTQGQLAAEVGVTVYAVSKWDQKLSFPQLRPKQLAKLMDVLGCSLADLVEAEESWEADNG